MFASVSLSPPDVTLVVLPPSLLPPAHLSRSGSPSSSPSTPILLMLCAQHASPSCDGSCGCDSAGMWQRHQREALSLSLAYSLGTSSAAATTPTTTLLLTIQNEYVNERSRVARIAPAPLPSSPPLLSFSPHFPFFRAASYHQHKRHSRRALSHISQCARQLHTRGSRSVGEGGERERERKGIREERMQTPVCLRRNGHWRPAGDSGTQEDSMTGSGVGTRTPVTGQREERGREQPEQESDARDRKRASDRREGEREQTEPMLRRRRSSSLPLFRSTH